MFARNRDIGGNPSCVSECPHAALIPKNQAGQANADVRKGEAGNRNGDSQDNLRHAEADGPLMAILAALGQSAHRRFSVPSGPGIVQP